MSKKTQRVLVFGATGSIGLSAIKVIENQNFDLVGFSFNKNINKAIEIKKKFPNALIFSPSIKDVNNVNSFEELLENTKPDIVLNSIVGFAGLHITLLTIKSEIDLALANKESLVIAGWLIKKMLMNSKTKIYPVDSEHSSLYDLLIHHKDKKIKELIITCSGGPFFNKSFEELENVTFTDAIKHPNWNMGSKISIDSATLMNKCFEIIEAYYLFDTKNIKTIQHGQSVIHSMIKFNDNSYVASMSVPDMKWAIQQGLTRFDSNLTSINDLDFSNLNLSFSKIDCFKWKAIQWANDFLENENKSIPIIMNAANDIAIELFQNNQIKFNSIYQIIEKSIIAFESTPVNDLHDILSLYNNTKKYALDIAKNLYKK